MSQCRQEEEMKNVFSLYGHAPAQEHWGSKNLQFW